jgi:hypothetical protein
MLVLFPDQDRANERGLRNLRGDPICRHHAAVQFSARYLENQAMPQGLPDAWTTIDISGLWVGFSATPRLEPRLAEEDGQVPGVPYLPGLVEKIQASLDPSIDD